MERGFKYRIYSNESQRDQIARTFGCCRFVYNRALDVKKTAYSETGKSIATNDLIKMIPAWKRDPDTSWLAQVDSMALQQSIRDLDRAYKNFFRRVREGGKPGFPKFKSLRHARQSYRTNGGKILDRNHIALPKLGNVRAKVSRPLQGRFMSVTVSLDAAGRYFATFLCTDVPSKDAPATDREVGIDLGVKTLATLSDGTKIENPRGLERYERKLAREQRRLSRRRNRLKTAVELIEKEITAYEQRSRDLYLKRATDGMSIDDFNSALSRIRNDVDKLRLKSKRASSELLHLNESIAAESIRMETVLKAAGFNHLDKTKVSMLIESVYVHKRDPKSGTQAIDITWKF